MRSENIKDWSFDDLASYVAQDLFDALIQGGTSNMKQRFYITYNKIQSWEHAMNLKEKKR